MTDLDDKVTSELTAIYEIKPGLLRPMERTAQTNYVAVQLGQEVKIRCLLRSELDNPSFAWYFRRKDTEIDVKRRHPWLSGDQLQDDNMNGDYRFHTIKNEYQLLYIRKLSTEFVGTFTCIIRGSRRGEQKTFAHSLRLNTKDEKPKQILKLINCPNEDSYCNDGQCRLDTITNEHICIRKVATEEEGRWCRFLVPDSSVAPSSVTMTSSGGVTTTTTKLTCPPPLSTKAAPTLTSIGGASRETIIVGALCSLFTLLVFFCLFCLLKQRKKSKCCIVRRYKRESSSGDFKIPSDNVPDYNYNKIGSKSPPILNGTVIENPESVPFIPHYITSDPIQYESSCTTPWEASNPYSYANPRAHTSPYCKKKTQLLKSQQNQWQARSNSPVYVKFDAPQPNDNLPNPLLQGGSLQMDVQHQKPLLPVPVSVPDSLYYPNCAHCNAEVNGVPRPLVEVPSSKVSSRTRYDALQDSISEAQEPLLGTASMESSSVEFVESPAHNDRSRKPKVRFQLKPEQIHCPRHSPTHAQLDYADEQYDVTDEDAAAVQESGTPLTPHATKTYSSESSSLSDETSAQKSYTKNNMVNGNGDVGGPNLTSLMVNPTNSENSYVEFEITRV